MYVYAVMVKVGNTLFLECGEPDKKERNYIKMLYFLSCKSCARETVRYIDIPILAFETRSQLMVSFVLCQLDGY